ncbi:hypothetical protein V6N12_003689 [Hibiscus sabdariffa]|uniref:Uncharacterized protein n=2 Tax=Hibiscus sabdariffa TaxID=183260 RepID=A0ABR1ZXP2_9ROSI
MEVWLILLTSSSNHSKPTGSLPTSLIQFRRTTLGSDTITISIITITNLAALSQTKVSIPGQRAIGKIRLKCQRWDLKTEVTSYMIDTSPAWIHSVLPSTLHQCFKYVDEKVGFYLPPDCLSRLPYSLRDLIASYPFLACSFSTFASSALNEQSDAGLPVDCGVLVLVDFAYLFLVLGQAALAQVESVAVGIK